MLPYMKRLFLFLFLFSLIVPHSFSEAPDKLYENAEGVLNRTKCIRTKKVLRLFPLRIEDKCIDSIFIDAFGLTHRDTILPTGKKAQLYTLNKLPIQYSYEYYALPNGANIILGRDSSFVYPNNLQPGIYMYAEGLTYLRCRDCVYPTVIINSIGYLSRFEKSNTSDYSSINAPSDCAFNGKSLNGNVRIVGEYDHPDFRVRIVERNEDLTVRYYTNSWGTGCGWWRVDSGYGTDFTVAFVDKDEDFTVRIIGD